MLQLAVLQIHLNVFSPNHTPLCSELVCFCGFQFSDRFEKSISLKVLAVFFQSLGEEVCVRTSVYVKCNYSVERIH